MKGLFFLIAAWMAALTGAAGYVAVADAPPERARAVPAHGLATAAAPAQEPSRANPALGSPREVLNRDRKSTRLNSSH